MKNSILLSGSALVVLSTISKVMGFVREQAFASALGASNLSDAYVLALFIATFAYAVPAAILTSAFLPIYSAYRARGEMERAAVFGRTVGVLSLATCAMVAVCGATASPWLVRLVGPGLSPETAALAAKLTAALFPALGAATLVGLTTAALNSHGWFGLPALYPIVQNTFMIAGVVLLTRRFSVWGIAFGTIAGCFIGLLIQLPWLLKITPLFSRGPWNLKDEPVKQMLRMAGPLVLMALVGQVYGLVDKSLASGLQPGSMAALNYAVKVVQLPTTVAATAVCTVMFPRFAECCGRKDDAGLADLVVRSVTVISALVIPAAFAFATLSVPVVRVVYQRGAFSELAVNLTASAMVFYSAGVVFQSLMLLLTRVAYAMQNSKTPLVISIVANTVAIGTAYALVPSMAHNGLALANSIGGAISTLLLGWAILKRVDARTLGKLGAAHARIVLASLVMVFTARLLLARFPVTGGDLYSAVRFLTIVLLSMAVYGATLLISGIFRALGLARLAKRYGAFFSKAR